MTLLRAEVKEVSGALTLVHIGCKSMLARYFHHQRAVDIIRTLYYIQGARGDENIFAVLYVFYMGLTHCYKTTVFLDLYQVWYKSTH